MHSQITRRLKKIMFGNSNLAWVCIKEVKCTVPHQGNPCQFDHSGLAFWSATTFPGYIPMYTGVHLDVSLWWGMHGLCIPLIWVWKCYINSLIYPMKANFLNFISLLAHVDGQICKHANTHFWATQF